MTDIEIGNDEGGDAMTKFRIKTNMFALVAICALSVSLPNTSFANLNDIACNAIWRGCLDKCGSHATQTCTANCDTRRSECALGLPNSKQQSPPPPCRGIRCTLRPTHPPTTVSDPAHPPRHPVEPVKPVGVSNPDKTGTGTSGPVILLRKNDSGGGQGQEHGHGH